MFLNLRSVIYDVEDLQQAKAWYTKVLDADPTIDAPTMVSFSIGSDRLLLNPVSKPVIAKDTGAVAYWAVSDVKAEYKRLIELGAQEDKGIRDIGHGVLLATLKDPFGNTIGIGGTGGTMDNRAIEEKPSETALWTTLMRAFAAGEENEEIRGADTLAEIFLTSETRGALKHIDNRQAFKDKHFVIGVCEYVMARTRLFDHLYRQALQKDGVEQIVLLGAGYDSRPYRFQELSRNIPVFELDILPTQKRKKNCLVEAGINIPPSITYVPINFNTQSIKDALYTADFDPTKQTLFVWEGVTYYLAPDAVDTTLEFIQSNSPAGSQVVFDYIALWPGIFDAYGVKELMQFNASKQSGESGAGFTIEEGKIESFLSARGFKTASHYDTMALENNFLRLKDGNLFGRVTGSFRIVQALTTG